MDDEHQVRVLESHLEPHRLEDSLRRCSEGDIRFLKNNGLLDCYYDFSVGSGMVFITEAGKECVRIHRYFEKIDDPRDLVSVEYELSIERYWDEIRKVSSTE